MSGNSFTFSDLNGDTFDSPKSKTKMVYNSSDSKLNFAQATVAPFPICISQYDLFFVFILYAWLYLQDVPRGKVQVVGGNSTTKSKIKLIGSKHRSENALLGSYRQRKVCRRSWLQELNKSINPHCICVTVLQFSELKHLM